MKSLIPRCSALLLSIFACLTATAQPHSSYYDSRAHVTFNDSIDSSIFECIYQHQVTDSTVNWSKKCMEILQVSNRFVSYRNYGDFKSDSILSKTDLSTLTNRKRQEIAMQCPIIIPQRPLLLDKSTNRWTFATRLFHADFIKCVEPTPQIKWRLVPGQETILGYKCRKATCTFRGRDWTVFYAPDIRVSYGPWKLHGLPGLILYAEESTGQHFFEAVGLRKKPSVIFKDRYIVLGKEMSREEFNRQYKDNRLNGLKSRWDAYDAEGGTPPAIFRHYPYAPYETE